MSDYLVPLETNRTSSATSKRRLRKRLRCVCDRGGVMMTCRTKRPAEEMNLRRYSFFSHVMLVSGKVANEVAVMQVL